MDGIIIYYPVFGTSQDQYLQQLVDVSKDVEGLSHRYIFNMYQNIRYLDDARLQKSVLPCTPLAVIKILEYIRIYNTILPYGNRLFGHTITVINRSEVVGRPLAALLANDGACVYSVDVKDVQQFTRGEGIKRSRHEVMEKPGWTLKDCLPLSDVVISGVPGPDYKVPVGLLREGAACINFSSEKVSSCLCERKNGAQVPPQNFDAAVKERASIYVPAIGKVTIVVLLRNILVSYLDGFYTLNMRATDHLEANYSKSQVSRAHCPGSWRPNARWGCSEEFVRFIGPQEEFGALESLFNRTGRND